jgi:2-polyprenyl-3-methyl-5-hydroxy-6-metoxy-1,4-benzoquinol methylase
MTATIQQTSDSVTAQRDALVERLLQSTSGMFDIFTVYLGDRLGFYDALTDNGPLTSAELAARTGTHERYAREWLEQQTVAGIVVVQETQGPGEQRTFSLPAGHAEVLVDRESLNYLAPLTQLAAGAVRPLPALVDAYRSGTGVPYEAYGVDLREGQGRMNRAMFLYQLGQEWLPSIADVDGRLKADPPGHIADFGCGVGWSGIGMAQSYPNVRVDGFDLDAPSVELANSNAIEAGVGERVRFQVRDAGDPELAGRYDLVTAFECIHDMSDPVSALRTMRRLAKDDGTVLVVDERVGETFTPQGNEVEGFMYGWSVLHCLPVGMTEQPSAGTGTVMRPDMLRSYARAAGFTDIEILPIENYFFRFYRLVQ